MAVRAYPQFYPTIIPSDIMTMVQPSHFLPYLDNLVQSQAESQRYSKAVTIYFGACERVCKYIKLYTDKIILFFIIDGFTELIVARNLQSYLFCRTEYFIDGVNP